MTYYEPDCDSLEHALEIAALGMRRERVRHYPGTGGLWFGPNQGMADATFTDWGLARAVAVILNAVADGKLVKAS